MMIATEVEDPATIQDKDSRAKKVCKYIWAWLLGPSKDRDTWNNNLEGVLSHIGYIVGLGNMWLFPYLCYKYGGATFLIPYGVCLLVIGLPEFFMDISLGQYLSLGPTHVYSYMAPIFSGLGWAMVTMAVVVSVYYNVVLGWTLYYLACSFQSTPPWKHCTNNNNATDCSQEGVGSAYLASEKFFRETVLAVSSPDEFELQGHLVLCVGVAWITVMACLVRGVRSFGKVAYVTVTVPYVILVLLLAWHYDTMPQGMWEDSLKNYFSLRQVTTTKLLDLELWADAATQVSFSLGAVYGGHTTLSSYNTFRQNTLRNAIIIVTCNTMSSILCGFVVFVSLSQLAADMSVSMDDVFNNKDKMGQKGSELVFIAYPALFSHMPNSLWPLLFFLMIFALGIDSMIGFMETSTTALFDNFKSLRRMYLPVMAVVACFLCLLSLPFCTSSGIYMVDLLHSYTSRILLMVLGLLKLLVVHYVYGFKKFMKLVEEEMQVWIPRPVYWYLALTLKVLTPICLAGLLVWTVFGQENQMRAGQMLPSSYKAVGWSLATIICFIVPVFAAHAIFHNRNQHWQKLFKETKKFLPRYILESQRTANTYILSGIEAGSYGS